MKQITIRDIPDEIRKTVQKEAARKGVSLNKEIISLLDRAAGAKVPGKKKVYHHDLDHLSGLWSRKEAALFDKALKAMRDTDPGTWGKTK